MPHLQFDINRRLSDAIKRDLSARASAAFARIMGTGTGHIAVSIREYDTHNLALGRADDPEAGIALVDADVRAGRSLDQRRRLALEFMALLDDLAGIARAQIYLTFTQHPGEDFHLSDRYLASWQSDEAHTR